MGQLSLEHESDVSTLQRIPLDESCDIIQVSGGSNHTVAVTAKGEVLVSGDNSHGQLGIPLEKSNVFVINESLENIVSAGCLWESTICLDANGKLWVFGRNSKNELGLEGLIEKPTLLDFCSEKIVKIACGLYSSIAVTESGRVWSWGVNRKGLIGHRDSELVEKPTLIAEISDIVVIDVAIGQFHSIFLTNTQTLLLNGSNKHGQLLNLPEKELVLYPFSDFPAENIKQIECGWNHSCILFSNGDLLLCGRNNFSQLGIFDPLTKRNLIQNLQIQKIASGSEHVLILTELQELYSFGWNEHGNCATGSTNSSSPMSRVYLYGHVESIFCFYAISFVHIK